MGYAAIAQDRYLINESFEAPAAGVSFGYVNQQLQLRAGGYSRFANGIWSDGEGKRLHGVYFGIPVQHTWAYGVGFYTALNLEIFMSMRDTPNTTEGSVYEDFFDMYAEMTLNIPLHLQYTLPLGDEFAVGMRLGPAFSWMMLDSYEDSRGYFEDAESSFRSVNFTIDFGLFAYLGGCRLDVLWQSGLTDHGFTYGSDNTPFDITKRNRFSTGLTIFID